MQSIQDMEAVIPQLPIADQIELRDRLDESIDDLHTLNQTAMVQADIALMEQRLDDYEAGQSPGEPWEVVVGRIKESLRL